MYSENFYIKAPVELLTQPIELEYFRRDDGSYMTIPEYLRQLGHEQPRTTLDGKYFIQGFEFTLPALDTVLQKAKQYGLTLDENFWILSPSEANKEVQKPEWVGELGKPNENIEDSAQTNV